MTSRSTHIPALLLSVLQQIELQASRYSCRDAVRCVDFVGGCHTIFKLDDIRGCFHSMDPFPDVIVQDLLHVTHASVNLFSAGYHAAFSKQEALLEWSLMPLDELKLVHSIGFEPTHYYSLSIAPTTSWDTSA